MNLITQTIAVAIAAGVAAVITAVAVSLGARIIARSIAVARTPPTRLIVAASIVVVAVVASYSSAAWAGPYLNTSAMLLHESSQSTKWVRANLGDKELARSAAMMARARCETAGKMNVPPEVRQAHPHMLLALAAVENAMQAAVDGKTSDFIRHVQTSSGEVSTFQAVLKTLGFSLPEYGRSAMHRQQVPMGLDLLITRRSPSQSWSQLEQGFADYR
ncbi:MAG: hypothetical protein FWD57_05435, partial [Polyangiaceae bacterium]|nr:hypothetical protein [Polyangiaceae bacterium]